MTVLRLFVAIPAPDSVRDLLLATQARLAASGADVRWEPGEKLHCTLVFLGETPAERLEDVVRAVRQGARGTGPFEVGYRGIGFFPGPDRPRIVWAGIEDAAEVLARLHGAMVAALVAAGIPCDEKPFHAHVTLGRVRGLRHLARLTTNAKTCTLEHPPVTVREIVIVRSALKPGGSEYSVLQSLPLTA